MCSMVQYVRSTPRTVPSLEHLSSLFLFLENNILVVVITDIKNINHISKKKENPVSDV